MGESRSTMAPEVLELGGGMAGLCAALAAAEQGARVLVLVRREGVSAARCTCPTASCGPASAWRMCAPTPGRRRRAAGARRRPVAVRIRVAALAWGRIAARARVLRLRPRAGGKRTANDFGAGGRDPRPGRRADRGRRRAAAARQRWHAYRRARIRPRRSGPGDSTLRDPRKGAPSRRCSRRCSTRARSVPC